MRRVKIVLIVDTKNSTADLIGDVKESLNGLLPKHNAECWEIVSVESHHTFLGLPKEGSDP